MIGALYNGLSGMASFQDALTAGSNNIANINTVGYKSDTVSFADMAYSASGQGRGAQTNGIVKDFSQGNFELTGGEYDLAISGKGFFTVHNPEDEADDMKFTRAGNFRVGNDGTLQMPNGFKVIGISTASTATTSYPTDASTTMFTVLHNESITSTVLRTDSEIITINAKSTNYTSTAAQTGTSGIDLETADSKIADISALKFAYNQALSTQSNSSITPAEVAPNLQQDKLQFTSSFATELTKSGDYVQVLVNGNTIRQDFDTDAQTTMNLFADKISRIQGLKASVEPASTDGEITITTLIPGQAVSITNAEISDTPFTSTSDIITTASPSTIVAPPATIEGSGMVNINAIRAALETAIEGAGGEFLEITNSINLNATTFTTLQTKLDDLGFSDNQFGEAEIEDGVVYLKQGENRFVIAKIPIHAFTNNAALIPEGDNVYSTIQDAGAPKEMTGLSTVLAGTLERSNAELSEGLVDLMVYQRAFEANSKIFAAADEFLNIAIQLKK